MLIALNKPFRVLCQFTDRDGHATLAAHVAVPGVYPAGRLDHDSEGLLLLTDDGALQARIADPRHRLSKRYLVQVEGVPDDTALARLCDGVLLRDGPTRPACARRIEAPRLWPRDPPVRFRRHIPTSWLEITLGDADLAPQHPDDLARADAARGPQPPGAAHDRRGRPPDAAPGAGRHRAVVAE